MKQAYASVPTSEHVTDLGCKEEEEEEGGIVARAGRQAGKGAEEKCTCLSAVTMWKKREMFSGRHFLHAWRSTKRYLLFHSFS